MNYKKAAIVLALSLSLCVIGYFAMTLVLKRSARQIESYRTGYLAELGGVLDTYGEVTAYLNREFPAGMTKPEVVARLDSKFVYEFTGGYRKDKPAGVYDMIVFPGRDCDKERFHDPQTDCWTITFFFNYRNGLLDGIALSESP